MLDVCLSSPKFFYETLRGVCFSAAGFGLIYQVNCRCIDSNQAARNLLNSEQPGRDVLKKLLANDGQPFRVVIKITGRLRIIKVWPHRVILAGRIYQLSLIKILR